jgi:cytochrome c553
MFCFAMLAPLPVSAMPVVQQEFLEAMQAKPALNRGADSFTTCAACHGPNGAGTADGAIPRIGGQHLTVLVKQLVEFRHGGRWDLRMENFADRHHLADVQAIADVAAYVNGLEPAASSGIGPGDLVTHGASVYLRNCASCHGPSGEGDASRNTPKIGGQHFEYLRRQIYDAVDGRRPEFPPAHVRLLARLEHDDIVGLADYLSRLGPNSPSHRGP